MTLQEENEKLRELLQEALHAHRNPNRAQFPYDRITAALSQQAESTCSDERPCVSCFLDDGACLAESAPQPEQSGLVDALESAEIVIKASESALRHLLHNIKASGKRVDLGLAPSSADEALRRINQYRRAALSSQEK